MIDEPAQAAADQRAGNHVHAHCAGYTKQTEGGGWAGKAEILFF